MSDAWIWTSLDEKETPKKGGGKDDINIESAKRFIAGVRKDMAYAGQMLATSDAVRDGDVANAVAKHAMREAMNAVWRLSRSAEHKFGEHPSMRCRVINAAGDGINYKHSWKPTFELCRFVFGLAEEFVNEGVASLETLIASGGAVNDPDENDSRSHCD